MRGLVRGRLGKSIELLLAASTLAGCQKWTTVESPIASTVERNDPGRVRITTVDGQVVELDSPGVEGDSIRGSLAGVDQPAIALGDIEKLEFRETNAGLIAISIAGAVAIAIAVILATNPSEESP